MSVVSSWVANYIFASQMVFLAEKNSRNILLRLKLGCCILQQPPISLRDIDSMHKAADEEVSANSVVTIFP